MASEPQRLLHILAEAGRVLGGSLDRAFIVRSAPAVVVPDLADAAVLHLIRDDLLTVAAVRRAGADPLEDGRIERALAAAPPMADMVAEVAATGRPRLRADMPPGGAPPSLAALDPGALLVVPVSAVGRVMGTLTLAMARGSGRTFCEGVPDLAVELGARIGIALHHAQLYAQAREAEQRLRESEARERARAADLEALMKSVPAAVWITANDGTIRANRAACELLGLPVPETGMAVTATAALREQLMVLRNGERLLGENLPTRQAMREQREIRDIELEVVRTDGGRRFIHGNAAPVLDEGGRPRGAISAFLDVTARHQAERARRETARRFLELANMVPAIVWTARPDGHLDYLNERWADTVGVPSADCLGERWFRYVHADDRGRVVEHWRRARSGVEPFETELRLRAPEGWRWQLVRALPMMDADGTVTAWFGTTIDIEDKIRQEGRLREETRRAEQADAAKSRFLAAASHDLRQPFQSMRLFLHLLREQVEGAPAELVGRLSDALSAGEDLLGKLLDISTLDAGTVKPRPAAVELEPLFARLGSEFAPLAEAKGIALRVRALPSAVVSDPVLLERILRNLLSNALKYTDAGGILLTARRRGRGLRLQVWDTGRGIPADKQAQVFEEFYQLDNPERDRSRGLGLGLSIVSRVARMLEHPLQLRSVPGRGTVVSLEVPRAPTRPVTVSATPTQAARPLDAAILVIEDDALQRLAMQHLLIGWGCRPLCAASAAEALALLRDGARPDLVVSDLRLPGGVDGFEAVTQVRAAVGPDLPALLLTGETGAGELRQAAQLGFRMLHKPYNPRTLRHALEELLPEREAAAALGR
ncbi:MAG TPA: ATP-binding protein [Azospirillaceae bacterium]|nr:ATP-binding protein [Azospirillaceae bacterium]